MNFLWVKTSCYWFIMAQNSLVVIFELFKKVACGCLTVLNALAILAGKIDKFQAMVASPFHAIQKFWNHFSALVSRIMFPLYKLFEAVSVLFFASFDGFYKGGNLISSSLHTVCSASGILMWNIFQRILYVLVIIKQLPGTTPKVKTSSKLEPIISNVKRSSWIIDCYK